MSITFGSRLVTGIAALGAVLCLQTNAQAHFILQSPPASTEQNALGDPQKAPPCGDNGDAVATGVVTSYEPGETITVTIEEMIFHPGHYRIVLVGDDINDIPAEPIVTPDAMSPCGSAPIDMAPVFPVLADGVFEHTTPFTEPQSIEVTLPDDLSCTNCTLQVIQFMSNHALNNPGGCYYHHCASVALDGEAGGDTTAGDDGMGSDDAMDTAGDDNADDDTSGNVDDVDDDGDADADIDDDDGNADADDAAADSDGGGTAPATDSGQADGGDDSDSGCSCTSGGLPDPVALGVGLFGLALLRRRR